MLRASNHAIAILIPMGTSEDEEKNKILFSFTCTWSWWLEKKPYKIKPAAHSHTKFKKFIDIKEVAFLYKKRKKKRKKSYPIFKRNHVALT